MRDNQERPIAKSPNRPEPVPTAWVLRWFPVRPVVVIGEANFDERPGKQAAKVCQRDSCTGGHQCKRAESYRFDRLCRISSANSESIGRYQQPGAGFRISDWGLFGSDSLGDAVAESERINLRFGREVEGIPPIQAW